MRLRKIDELDLAGKKVLLRLDLNVPIHDGIITDATRITKALPTIQYLLENQAKLAIVSHLGRPKGEKKQSDSLMPVGDYLAKQCQCEVIFVKDFIRDGFAEVFSQATDGQLVLLENIRFNKGETQNDPVFARKLSGFFDFFVNDAFGTLHRAHGSVVGVAECLPPATRAAGFLVQQECRELEAVRDSARHPFTVILGGAKVSDKIGVILNLVEKCNSLLIGGAMAYTFLHYKGIRVGNSRVEHDKMDAVRRIYETANLRKVEILLPVDHVVAKRFAEEQPALVQDSVSIQEGDIGLDIGPRTRALFQDTIIHSKTVLWNGPMGVFEWDSFSEGTMSVARCLASLKGVKTVVGGGDSVAALHKAGVSEKISHVSTGGGASLEFLEGKMLPGLRVLLAN